MWLQNKLKEQLSVLWFVELNQFRICNNKVLLLFLHQVRLSRVIPVYQIHHLSAMFLSKIYNSGSFIFVHSLKQFFTFGLLHISHDIFLLASFLITLGFLSLKLHRQEGVTWRNFLYIASSSSLCLCSSSSWVWTGRNSSSEGSACWRPQWLRYYIVNSRQPSPYWKVANWGNVSTRQGCSSCSV